MTLGVPVSQVLHMVTARGPSPVSRAVRRGGWPEQRAPVGAPSQPKCGIDCVAGFVSQNAHQPVAVAAFYLAGHLALEAQQARMSEIKRYRDTRNPVRRKPLFGQPHVRT